MSVYCEPKAEATVLRELEGARRVLVVGCPMCANLSSAAQNDVPAYALGFRGIRPSGMDLAVERLAGSLRREGARVESWVPGMPGTLCGLGGAARHKLRGTSRGVDAVVTLACESGEGSVREILGDVPVVGGMTATGLFAKRMRRGFGTVLVDKSSIRIVPISVNGPPSSPQATP